MNKYYAVKVKGNFKMLYLFTLFISFLFFDLCLYLFSSIVSGSQIQILF